jgi:hypothetical protein
MDNEHYRVDKLAIYEQQMQRAQNEAALIEKRSEGAPPAFLKANYGNAKIRERKSDPDLKTTISVALTKICALSGIRSK